MSIFVVFWVERSLSVILRDLKSNDENEIVTFYFGAFEQAKNVLLIELFQANRTLSVTGCTRVVFPRVPNSISTAF
jgi:hypothetical protein